MRKTLAAFALVTLFAADAALAQAPAPAPGVRQHDGFYLNLDLGGGALKTSASQGGTDLDLSGGAGQFSLALGVALTDNFILAGQIWGATVSDPTVEMNGTELGDADGTLTLSGIGVNVVYYFMPINLYLSATPSITQLSTESNGSSGETETGFGMRFAVGKEWWVSDNWAIGLNGQLAFSSNEDQGTDAPTWKTTWVGLAFSATFN